jgi:hypothetical protein
MALKYCPCRGCTERILLCHGRCERYQAWKTEYETTKNEYQTKHPKIDFPRAMLRHVYRRMKEGRMRK